MAAIGKPCGQLFHVAEGGPPFELSGHRAQMAAAELRGGLGPGPRHARPAKRHPLRPESPTRSSSPAHAASARPPSRASSPVASTARRADGHAPAASAPPASRSPRAARRTSRKWTPRAAPASTTYARSSSRSATPPPPARHRIFIIDEVHMLSTNAFNALLKTLEEPPPRSLFIFATTNPEKIPVHGALALSAPRPAPDRARDGLRTSRRDLPRRRHRDLAESAFRHRPRRRRLDARRPDAARPDRGLRRPAGRRRSRGGAPSISSITTS